MRVSPTVTTLAVVALAAVLHPAEGQFWTLSQQLFNPIAWLRQGKTSDPKTLFSNPPQTSSILPSTKSPATVHPTIPVSFPSTVASTHPQKAALTTLKVLTPSRPVSNSTLTSSSSTTTATSASTITSGSTSTTTTSTAGPVAVSILASTSSSAQPQSSTPKPSTNVSAAVSNATKAIRTTLSASSTTKRALKMKSTISPSTHRVTHSSSKSPITSSSQRTTTSTLKHAITNAHPHAVNGSVTSANSVTEAAGLSVLQERTANAQDADELEDANEEDDATTQEATGTTEEPRDNHRQHDFYLSKREKPQVKIASNISQNLLPLPAGASAALVKPTKYHYYPHNQHIYLLPECAIQQVCNAVYVRLNWTQPLCACPSRYRDPCSASLNSDDQHTTELQIDRSSRRALTLVKTCEPTTEMRICRAPRDWSLLALQNIRTGKSHYLVICRCQESSVLEGPMSHDQPTYASVPGIRVYGMMCVQTAAAAGGIKRRGRPLRLRRRIEYDEGDYDIDSMPAFPWDKAIELAKTADWEDN